MKMGGIFSSTNSLGLDDEQWTTPATLLEPLTPPKDEKTPVQTACPEGSVLDASSGKCSPMSVAQPATAVSTKTNTLTLKEAAPWLIGAAVLGFVLVRKIG